MKKVYYSIIGVLLSWFFCSSLKAQTEVLGMKQDSVISIMYHSYRSLIFVRKDKYFTNEDRLTYIDKSRREYVFRFNNDDLCTNFDFLTTQSDVPEIIMQLNKQFKKISKNTWESLEDKLHIELETIEGGVVSVRYTIK